MTQFYSDPSRENETYALPDAETFHVSAEDILRADDSSFWFQRMREIVDDAPGGLNDDELDTLQREHAAEMAGWYYWYCFPGCLPECEPTGPFKTEQEAIDSARENA